MFLAPALADKPRATELAEEADTANAPALISFMPYHQKTYAILDLVAEHKLELDVNVPSAAIKGVLLVRGAQSTGKTSLINRIIGEDVLVTTQKLGTR